jgi:hypothetical protein
MDWGGYLVGETEKRARADVSVGPPEREEVLAALAAPLRPGERGATLVSAKPGLSLGVELDEPLTHAEAVAAGYENLPSPEGTGDFVRFRRSGPNDPEALRELLAGLEELLGYELPLLRVVGPAAQDKAFLRALADAVHRPVCAGPCDAAYAGQVGAELLREGKLPGRFELRKLIAQNFDFQTYAP